MGFMDKLKGAAKAVSEKAGSVAEQMKEGQEISKRINEMDDSSHVYGETLTTGEGIENYIGFKFRVNEITNKKDSAVERFLVYQAAVTKTEMATVKKFSILDEFTEDDIQSALVEELNLSGNTLFVKFKLLLQNGTAYSYLTSVSFDSGKTFGSDSSIASKLMDQRRVKFIENISFVAYHMIYVLDSDSQNLANTLFDVLLEHHSFAQAEETTPEQRKLFENGNYSVENFFNMVRICDDALDAYYKDALEEIIKAEQENQ